MTTPPEILPYSALSDPPRFARLLLKPVAYPFLIVSLLWSLFTLWELRIPQNIFPTLIIFFSAIALCVYWLLRQFIRLVLLRIYKQPFSNFLRRANLSIFALLVGLFTILAVEFQLPFELAFQFSRPALERFADDALTHPATLPSETSVGLFPLYNLHADPVTHTFRFLISRSGFLDGNGLAVYRGPALAPSTAALHDADPQMTYYITSPDNWYRIHFPLKLSR